MAKKISGTRRNVSSTRAAKNTTSGSNAMEIQRNINADYASLGRDYQKLAVELWRIPVTRYILGGIALTALAPFLFRSARKVPQLDSFFSDLRDDLVDMKGSLSSKISSWRGSAGDEITDLQH